MGFFVWIIARQKTRFLMRNFIDYKIFRGDYLVFFVTNE